MVRQNRLTPIMALKRNATVQALPIMAIKRICLYRLTPIIALIKNHAVENMTKQAKPSIN